ncbi:MAG: hypothetical protein LIP01_05595 [Tannerellaceae bacterium]|nr:hypothetical protein [Tannerellaceae bacterium]
MIKQIFKIIWAQRRNNGWIFAELLIVTGVLWIMLDGIFTKMRIYQSPLGYDIENVYYLHLSNLNPNSSAYVPEEERISTEGEDLLHLIQRIRNNPEVEDVCISYYSAPYSWGDSWTSLYPVDGDTTISHGQGFQSRRVSPEFFNVFRIKDKKGNLILSENIPQTGTQIIISADMEELFFTARKEKGGR